jgi:hypothetical protein
VRRTARGSEASEGPGLGLEIDVAVGLGVATGVVVEVGVAVDVEVVDVEVVVAEGEDASVFELGPGDAASAIVPPASFTFWWQSRQAVGPAFSATWQARHVSWPHDGESSGFWTGPGPWQALQAIRRPRCASWSKWISPNVPRPESTTCFGGGASAPARTAYSATTTALDIDALPPGG